MQPHVASVVGGKRSIWRSRGPWLALLGALCLPLPSSGFVQAQGGGTLTFGIVPQFPVATLVEMWRPMLDELEAELGLTIELVLADTIPDFETAFANGAYDVAFMNPYHVVMAHRAQGYEPVVSDGSRLLRGILVVPVDSEVQSVADLDGRVIAFPSPNAFGASLYMRALLRESEGIDFTATYVETHANAYRHALFGRADAAGGVRNTLQAEDEALQSRLRIVFETPGVTPHPLAVHPRVPAGLRDRLVAAVLRLAETDEGRAMLARVQLSAPILVTYEDHFAQLLALRLEDYVIGQGF